MSHGDLCHSRSALSASVRSGSRGGGVRGGRSSLSFGSSLRLSTDRLSESASPRAGPSGKVLRQHEQHLYNIQLPAAATMSEPITFPMIDPAEGFFFFLAAWEVAAAAGLVLVADEV